jgi:CxxC motif-containing protein/NADPH-dependent 2,4-dienoyl-CoA reductase/sulfur reductase-like enzyme
MSEMRIIQKEVIVIGGGPAGMAAALALKENGIENILILEREHYMGGILNQCIHDGFGLVLFEKNFTGPEYAALYLDRLIKNRIDFLTGAAVTDISRMEDERSLRENRRFVVHASTTAGRIDYRTAAVVLATGCREKPRGALTIPGTRPAGIYTAGTAQNFVNLKNLLPGTSAVILGSGDIGLIMARRLTLEGIKVLAVIEKEKTAGGLQRNVVQCLQDFDIPLLTESTITNIFGQSRLTGVEVSALDPDGSIRPGSSTVFDCDTLILSVGLIPENEAGLSAGIRIDERSGLPVTDGGCQSTVEGVFVCGNALYVHDLVDDVSLAGELAGRAAAGFVKGLPRMDTRSIIERQKQRMANRRNRSGKDSIICILCPNGCEITKELKGAMCGKGIEYAAQEILSPERTLTSSVKVLGGERPLVSVRTTGRIPKEQLAEAMEIIQTIEIVAPATAGQILCRNFLNSGSDLATTGDVKKRVASES